MTDLDDLRRRADRFDPPRAELVVVPGAKCKGCDGPITARPGYEALKDYCSRTCEDRAWRRRKKAEREALEARVSLLAPFSLGHEGEFTWLVYEHADGTRCAVTQVDCPAVLETLAALLDAPAPHPTPTPKPPPDRGHDVPARRTCIDCPNTAPPGKSRCPDCQRRTNRARGSATARGYDHTWQRHARQAITAHRTQHGDTCPGWNRPAHTIHPTDWVCDHDIGPLCRPCNSSKAGSHDRQRATQQRQQRDR